MMVEYFTFQISGQGSNPLVKKISTPKPFVGPAYEFVFSMTLLCYYFGII